MSETKEAVERLELITSKAALPERVRGFPGHRKTAGGGHQPCPACGADKSGVIDSRRSPYGIRRRRCCGQCGERFTTYELHVEAGSALSVLLKSFLPAPREDGQG